MHAGIALLNFGEPAEPTRESVVAYLERIFYDNAAIEGETAPEAARERSRRLAERRAPALIEEYEEIGGSPLATQARGQADALESALRDRGFEVTTYVGTQFVEPFVDDAVAAARDDGVDLLVGLPVYPLCGPSTTVASLRELSGSVADRDWDVPVRELTGWHRYPPYNRVRADNVRSFVADEGLDLTDDDTRLVFSAHGTPEYYLERGSRYREYVEEYCATQASVLDVPAYEVGYQNHANRDVDWTRPEVEDVVADLGDDAGVERVVVEPVSFVHEQSETLSELDVELREDAADAGLDFHRVPVPHDDPDFVAALADLVEPFLSGADPEYYGLRECACRDAPGARCLNAAWPR